MMVSENRELSLSNLKVVEVINGNRLLQSVIAKCHNMSRKRFLLLVIIVISYVSDMAFIFLCLWKRQMIEQLAADESLLDFTQPPSVTVSSILFMYTISSRAFPGFYYLNSRLSLKRLCTENTIWS